MDDFDFLDDLETVESAEQDLQREIVRLPDSTNLDRICYFVQQNDRPNDFFSKDYLKNQIATRLVRFADKESVERYFSKKINLPTLMLEDFFQSLGLTSQEIEGHTSYFKEILRGANIEDIGAEIIKEEYGYDTVLGYKTYNADTISVANAVLSLIPEQRRNKVESIDDICMLVALSATQFDAGTHINDENISNGGLLVYALHKGKISIEEAEKINTCINSGAISWNLLQKIKKSNVKEEDIYGGLIAKFREEVSAKFGIYIRTPTNEDGQDPYTKFKESIAKLIVYGFTKDKLHENQESDFVISPEGKIYGKYDNHFFELDTKSNERSSVDGTQIYMRHGLGFFQEGDDVEIFWKNAPYNFTRFGSYGTVIDVRSSKIDVRFEVCTGNRSHNGNTYDIYPPHLRKKVNDQKFNELVEKDKGIISSAQNLFESLEDLMLSELKKWQDAIQGTIKYFRALGVQDSVIGYVMSVEQGLRSKLIPEQDCFEELRLKKDLNIFSDAANNITSQIMEKTGTAIHPYECTNQKELENLIKSLPIRFLAGFEFDDLEISRRDYAVLVNQSTRNNFPVGTVGYLDGDMDFWPLSYDTYYDISKSDFKKVTWKKFPYSGKDAEVGDSVEVVKWKNFDGSYEDAGNKNENIPVGSKGVINEVSEEGIYVKLDMDVEDTFDDYTSNNVVRFHRSELYVFGDKESDKKMEAGLKMAEKRLAPIYNPIYKQIETGEDIFIQKVRNIADQFRRIGYDRDYIRKIFLNEIEVDINEF